MSAMTAGEVLGRRVAVGEVERRAMSKLAKGTKWWMKECATSDAGDVAKTRLRCCLRKSKLKGGGRVLAPGKSRS